MNFRKGYGSLPDGIAVAAKPAPVASPRLFLWNDRLAADLGLDAIPDIAEREAIFSGNSQIAETAPVALAYAGHQFGHFVPSLGDGRAHLLGELKDTSGDWRDIQLKGSGRTPFSRGGDGLCALGPAIREFIMSEAVYALGVPTTRSLAVVLTGKEVTRESPLPGAVVTRVAASHLRVGTFQYFAAREDREMLETLCRYTAQRHYPSLVDADETAFDPELPLRLLAAVVERQIALISEWMRVGFIHGVMNTDNTALSGETIDYGPCAMMSSYDPTTVFSSIDRHGRYAFGNQPRIAQWNMARFAETLLPLIDDNEEAAIAKVTAQLESFPEQFETHYQQMMEKKLGVQSAHAPSRQREIAAFIADLLARMQAKSMDYTQTFNALTHVAAESPEAKRYDAELTDALGEWYTQWRSHFADQGRSNAAELMRQANPAVIPRNHHVEAILAECQASDDPTAAEQFLKALTRPYEDREALGRYQDAPEDGDRTYQTFCGT